MREIKFRAWHEGAKKMFSPYEMAKDQLTLLPTGKFINVHGGSTKLSEIYENMIPLQYTGVKDKNGQEIYEGDVVRFEKKTYAINWNSTQIVGFGYLDGVYFAGGMVPDDEIEVIGNIYENSELLK